jgi:hypothetical protein
MNKSSNIIVPIINLVLFTLFTNVATTSIYKTQAESQKSEAKSKNYYNT